MRKIEITKEIVKKLGDFLDKNEGIKLHEAFLFTLQECYKEIKPLIVKTKGKRERCAYKNRDEFLKICVYPEIVEKNKPVGQVISEVTAETKKLAICPCCGAVFTDNRYPDVQGAIYNHLLNCEKNDPENQGQKKKSYSIVTDKAKIAEHIQKSSPGKVLTSYAVSGTDNFFKTKEAAIQHLVDNHFEIEEINLYQMPMNCQLEASFKEMIQDQYGENLDFFMDELGKHERFKPYLAAWNPEEEEDSESQ